jgi:N-acetylneuraminic acid mutarotase
MKFNVHGLFPKRARPGRSWVVLPAVVALVGGLARAGALAADAAPPAAGPGHPGSAGAPCAGSPPGCGQGPGSAADLAGGSWSTMRAAPLAPRLSATVVWTGSQLVVWGGVVNTAGHVAPVADGAVWDAATGAWHAMAPSPLSAREAAAGTWDGHDVFIWGGDNASEHPASYRMSADGALYDPEANTWRVLPGSPLSARSRAEAIWTGPEVLVIGGGELDAPVSLPPADLTAAAYVPSSGQWRSLPTVPAASAGTPVGLSPAWTGQRLFVWVTSEVVRRSANEVSMNVRHVAASWAPGKTSWRRLPGPPVPTYGATVTWTGTDLVFSGGTSCLPLMFCPPEMLRPLPAYDPATGRWASLPANTRAGLSPMAWTGAALVTPAGNPRGAALDPGAPHWLALPPFPLGEPDGATAIWTGRQLLVWGGYGPTGRGSNVGALLTPGPTGTARRGERASGARTRGPFTSSPPWGWSSWPAARTLATSRRASRPRSGSRPCPGRRCRPPARGGVPTLPG